MTPEAYVILPEGRLDPNAAHLIPAEKRAHAQQ
jgi:hypothetical protein